MNGQKYQLVLTPIQYTAQQLADNFAMLQTRQALIDSLVEEERLRGKILLLLEAQRKREARAEAAKELAEFETVSHQLVGLGVSCDNEVSNINKVK